MTLDAVMLSRLQWTCVIAWHILLPAFTVGLASYIAVLEGLYLFTGREIFYRISGFWTKIFAVLFAMGVASGIIMPFQFGTNWSRFTDATADVLSPMLAYEGLMAFFLESTFLGILLFGRRLVPTWAHFFAALMVAFGTLLSSFWILSTNSWMQPPRVTKLSMADSSRSTGLPSSSTRRFLIGFCITLPPSTSPRRSSSWESGHGFCGTIERSKTRI
jgi:cytochrome d ubiquinol oxidase subunit I